MEAPNIECVPLTVGLEVDVKADAPASEEASDAVEAKSELAEDVPTARDSAISRCSEEVITAGTNS